MTTASQERVTPRQQRIHAAVGTAAIAVTFVATIVVGAPTLDITPSSGDISTFCATAGQCVQHVPAGRDLSLSFIQR